MRDDDSLIDSTLTLVVGTCHGLITITVMAFVLVTKTCSAIAASRKGDPDPYRFFHD